MSHLASASARRLQALLAANAGAGLVGFANAQVPQPGTVAGAVQPIVRLASMPGADPTGAADSTAAIVAALAILQARGGGQLEVVGVFRHTATITVPRHVKVQGVGITESPETADRAPSCFVKDFNGAGFVFSGDVSGVDEVQFDSAAGRTGDGVVVTGGRWRAGRIAVTNFERDGLRIGADEAAVTSTNINVWSVDFAVIVNKYQNTGTVAVPVLVPVQGRYGINVSHTRLPVSGNFGQGIPDVNGGRIGHCDIRWILGDGLRFGNTIDNWIGYSVIQHCDGRGVRFGLDARNNFIAKSYTESCTQGDGIFEAGATQNVVWAGRAVTLSSGWTNNGGNSNLVFAHESGIGADGAFNSSPWLWPEEFAVRAKGNVSRVSQWVGAALPAEWRVELSGVSGTRHIMATKREGNSPLDRITIEKDGLVSIYNTAGLLVGRNVVDNITPGHHFETAPGRFDSYQVGTTLQTRAAFWNGNGQVGRLETNGLVFSLFSASDYRLKRNVTKAMGGLAALLSWPTVEYEFAAEPGVRRVGFIAHELQAVEPGAVSGDKDATDEDGAIKPQAVSMDALVPKLVLAVQELHAALRARGIL